MVQLNENVTKQKIRKNQKGLEANDEELDDYQREIAPLLPLKITSGVTDEDAKLEAAKSIVKEVNDKLISSKEMQNQMVSIWHFMFENKKFAVGGFLNDEGRQTSKKMWEELTGMLNSDFTGAMKTPKEWQKVSMNILREY